MKELWISFALHAEDKKFVEGREDFIFFGGGGFILFSFLAKKPKADRGTDEKRRDEKGVRKGRRRGGKEPGFASLL